MWDATKSPGDLITSSDWNDMVTDQKGHASRHSDGGSDELDAADLAAGLGTNGQVLQSDGSAASWVDFQSGSDVSDNGSLVVSAPSDINFGNQLNVTDDTDGTVTVDANVSTESTTTVSSSYTTSGETTVFVEAPSSLTSTTVVDDFEDGDVAGWNGDTGNFSTSTTNANGTYSGELDAPSSESRTVNKDYSGTQGNISFQETTSNQVWFRVRDGTTNIAVLEIEPCRYDVLFNGTTVYSADYNTHQIEMSFDFENETVTLYKDGSEVATEDFLNSANQHNNIQVDYNEYGGICP